MSAEPFDLHRLLTERGAERYELQARHLNPQLPRMLHTIGFDKIYTRGEGAYLYDDEGRDYLDMLAGFGVFALGRHHPVVRQAMHDVIDAGLADLTQFDAPPLAGILAEQLLAKAPHLDRVYFGNSGTEAVEAALKFARYATGRTPHHLLRPRVPRPDHRLAVGQRRRRVPQGLRPAAAGHRRIPFGDLAALERELRQGRRRRVPDRADPGQGRRGRAHRASWPPRRTCVHKHKALLIADEVQSGIGRTGDFFAYEHDGVQPDIVAAAKALSGGYIPVGATMARNDVFEKVYSSIDRVLVHDSTFGSNAQAMAAGLATLHVFEQEDVVAQRAAHR